MSSRTAAFFAIGSRSVRRRNTQAAFSVTGALIFAAIVLPLGAGLGDGLNILAGKWQIHEAVKAFDNFAESNPQAATDVSKLSAILAAIDRHPLPHVTFPDGKADSSTFYQPNVFYMCSVPDSTAEIYEKNACPAGYGQQALISYYLVATVPLPVPIPFIVKNPVVLTATGVANLP